MLFIYLPQELKRTTTQLGHHTDLATGGISSADIVRTEIRMEEMAKAGAKRQI